jgi:hypothetical protein
MKNSGGISAFQFFCTVFVCRATALFTFIITDKESFPPGDRTVMFAPLLLLGTAACIPVLLVTGKKEDRTLFALTNRLHPAVSKGAALVYAAGTVWSAGVSLTRFDLFMSTVMFSGAKLWGLILLLAAAAVPIALRGRETVSRMSLPVLALLAASLVYVGVTVIGEFDPANLELPLRNGFMPLLTNGWSATARTGELAALLIFAPHIRGGVKKGVFFWWLSFGVTGSLLYTLIPGVLGAYGERQMFQLYALTVLSKLGAAERLDALICAIWVLCSLVRLAFHLIAAGMFLEGGFPVRRGAPLYCGLALPVLAVYFVLSRSVTVFARLIGSGINELIFLLLLIAVPLTVLSAVKIKTRMQAKKGVL